MTLLGLTFVWFGVIPTISLDSRLFLLSSRSLALLFSPSCRFNTASAASAFAPASASAVVLPATARPATKALATMELPTATLTTTPQDFRSLHCGET